MAVVKIPVASQERQVHINCLHPSTKYKITVVAEYSDQITREGSVEHTNCGTFSLQALLKSNVVYSIYN